LINSLYTTYSSETEWKRQRIAAAAAIPERPSLIRDRSTLEGLAFCDPGSRFGKTWMTNCDGRRRSERHRLRARYRSYHCIVDAHQIEAIMALSRTTLC